MRAMPPAPSMLALVDDMTGSALWRVLWPFTALEKRGYPCGWAPKDDALVGAAAPAFDGYLLPRVAWPGGAQRIAERWFAMLRSAGKLCVFDADDDIFSDACIPHLVGSGLADGQRREVLEERRLAGIWAMQRCDGVTVSTPYLADLVRRYTERPVVVVPNAIDLAWFRRVISHQSSVLSPQRGELRTEHRTLITRVGWVGGKRSDDDVAVLAAAWRRIARAYPSVRFVVGGHNAPVLVDAVPADRLEYRGWRRLEAYPSVYAGLDIGCAPVADTPFNRSKSGIKVMEYAAAGAAVVCTPFLYGGLVEGGETAYLAETADEWADALAELIERPAHRAILAKRMLREVERKHALKENLWRWPLAWGEIQANARCGDAHIAMA